MVGWIPTNTCTLVPHTLSKHRLFLTTQKACHSTPKLLPTLWLFHFTRNLHSFGEGGGRGGSVKGGGYLLSIVPKALFLTQNLGPAKWGWGWGGEHKKHRKQRNNFLCFSHLAKTSLSLENRGQVLAWERVKESERPPPTCFPSPPLFPQLVLFSDPT